MNKRLLANLEPSHMLGAISSNEHDQPAVGKGLDDKRVLGAGSFGNGGHALILAQIKQTQRVNNA